jgi:hypothetical protein
MTGVSLASAHQIPETHAAKSQPARIFSFGDGARASA